MVIVLDANTYELFMLKTKAFDNVPVLFTTANKVVRQSVCVVPRITSGLINKLSMCDEPTYIVCSTHNKQYATNIDRWLKRHKELLGTLMFKPDIFTANDELKFITTVADTINTLVARSKEMDNGTREKDRKPN